MMKFRLKKIIIIAIKLKVFSFFQVKSFEKAELFMFGDEFVRCLRNRANAKVKRAFFVRKG